MGHRLCNNNTRIVFLNGKSIIYEKRETKITRV